MSKVYISAVVIIPLREKWASIQEIRKKYDRQINRWMPHINLLYPFRPKDRFSNLKKKFSEVSESIKPFEILFNNLKYFNHGRQRYTMWLNPEPKISIINLQAELLKIVPDCDDVNKHKHGFTPHLSIGQIKGKEKLNEIINKLQKSWVPLKFILKEIYFISRENNKLSQFQIEEVIPLKN